MTDRPTQTNIAYEAIPQAINAFLLNLGAFNRECLDVERYSSTSKYLAYIFPKPGVPFHVSTDCVIRYTTLALDEVYYVINGINDTCEYLMGRVNIYRTVSRCQEAKRDMKILCDELERFNTLNDVEERVVSASLIIGYFRTIIYHRKLLAEELNSLPFWVKLSQRCQTNTLKNAMCFGGCRK